MDEIKKNVSLNNEDNAILQTFPIDTSLTDYTQGKPVTITSTGKIADIAADSKIIKLINTYMGEDRSDVSHVSELETACGIFEADVSYDMISRDSAGDIVAGAYLKADHTTKKWKIMESGPVNAVIEAVYPTENYCKVLFNLTLFVFI